MRVVSLGSGSSGNALLIEAGPGGRTKLLIDAGFSTRVLQERLQHIGISLRQLSGILVTHEHSDHILGLPTLTRRYEKSVIADPRTLAAIEEIFVNGITRSESGRFLPLLEEGEESISEKLLASFRSLSQVFPLGTRQIIGDVEVTSFPVSHDAAAPAGYLLHAGGCRVCGVIDTGEITSTMLEAISRADLLILESNHDRQRLLRGPYPYSLKMRILSPTGHLSNDQAAEAVLRSWRGDAVRWLWLSHLSRTNNTPKLALESMRSRIQEAGANLAQLHISVLPPDFGCMWDSTQLWHNTSLWEMSR